MHATLMPRAGGVVDPLSCVHASNRYRNEGNDPSFCLAREPTRGGWWWPFQRLSSSIETVGQNGPRSGVQVCHAMTLQYC